MAGKGPGTGARWSLMGMPQTKNRRYCDVSQPFQPASVVSEPCQEGEGLMVCIVRLITVSKRMGRVQWKGQKSMPRR